MVVATLLSEIVYNHWFSKTMFGNVVKPIALATLFLEVLKTNGFSNIVFDNVVKRRSLAVNQ